MAAITLVSVALLFSGYTFLHSADTLLSFILWFDCEFFRVETIIFSCGFVWPFVQLRSWSVSSVGIKRIYYLYIVFIL